MLSQLSLWMDEGLGSGPWNMAVDEALLECCRTPLLRVYGWQEPSVSVGFRFRLDALGFSPQVPVVRRITGGGMVWHGNDITFTLVVPEGEELAALGPRAIYRWLHGELAMVLSDVTGKPHRLASREETTDGNRCFESPVEHDVVCGGKKVAGGAQRRTRQGFLHQGSLQCPGLSADFWQQLAGQLAVQVSPFQPSAELRQQAEQLMHKRYLEPDWSMSATGGRFGA